MRISIGIANDLEDGSQEMPGERLTIVNSEGGLHPGGTASTSYALTQLRPRETIFLFVACHRTCVGLNLGLDLTSVPRRKLGRRKKKGGCGSQHLTRRATSPLLSSVLR